MFGPIPIRNANICCELLRNLTAAQWDTPSLCSEWRVRDVVGHMVSETKSTIRRCWAARLSADSGSTDSLPTTHADTGPLASHHFSTISGRPHLLILTSVDCRHDQCSMTS